MAAPASPREIEIMRAVYRKFDNMPLGFGIPAYDDDMPDSVVERQFLGDLRDTERELKLKNLDSVEEMSLHEMHIENRTVYHALKRFRLSSAIFFKFSTATDGKTVDKTMIPKMIAATIKEYDDEFKKWRSTLPVGEVWTRTNTVETSGDVEDF